MAESSSKRAKKQPRTGGGTISNNHSAVRMKSVLRIRPPLKKERDEHVVLEALANGKSAALHPYGTAAANANHHPLQHQSPHSTDTVQTGQDVELHFDAVLHANASQDKVYFTVGQPVALAAMDSLKKGGGGNKDAKKSSHLILSLGLPGSGKTFTSMGSPAQLTKRKADSDGLIPRIIDSLFFQSLHSSTCKQKNVSFAVEVSVLQINQSKTNPIECIIYDLLQPLPKDNGGGALGNIASSILSSAAVPAPVRKSRYAELSEPVSIKQDPTTSECYVTNATVKQCVTNEDARNALQKALSRSRQVSSKKKQSHLFVQVQPVLVSKRSGRIVLEGEMIGLLDMAGWEKHACTVSRSRDSLSSRTDAHSAVMHCLTAIKHNASSAYNKQKKVPFMQHKTTMILQPYFSASRVETTHLMLLASASPCGNEYSDKKMLLSEVLKIHRPLPNMVADTGCAVVVDNDEDDTTASCAIEVTCTPAHHNPRGRATSSDYATDLLKTDHATMGSEKKKKSKSKTTTIRASSKTYSDCSGKGGSDDDYCSEEEIVLPPPIVPGYKVTTEAPAVFSPAVSAPVIDSPQKDYRHISNAASPLPSPMKCMSPTSCDHVDNNDTNCGVAQKKSYFERIGKATKTGLKVLERIAVTTAIDASEADYQRQFTDLVAKNEEMEAKMKALEKENQKLAHENQRLKLQRQQNAVSADGDDKGRHNKAENRPAAATKDKQAKTTTKTTTTTAEEEKSCSEGSYSLHKPFGQVRVISMDDTSDAVSDIAESPKTPKTTASSFKSERSGRTNVTEVDDDDANAATIPPSAFDNPLMQQMACMATDWILSNSKPVMPKMASPVAATASHYRRISKTTTTNRQSTDNVAEERKENDSHRTNDYSPYDNDNALYQHMALMNGM